MNSYDLAEIWVRCKDKLKESFNEKVFNVWIKPIMPLEVTDTYYKVAVKNDFFKTMLEENYAQVIEGVLAGTVHVDDEIAACLGDFLGTDARFWLELQRHADHGLLTA